MADHNWDLLGRRVLAATCAFLLALMPAGRAFAEDAGSVRLDLSSSTQSVKVSQQELAGATSRVIDVGGNQKVIKAGDALTAAEFVAVRQAASGAQRLALDAAGRAVGGSFSFSQLGRRQLESLVLPAGVTGIGQAGRGLKIDGLLSTEGLLLGVQQGSRSRFNVRAGDVNVALGGSITTILPETMASLMKNASKSVDLSIFSGKDIINAGAITASGVLSLSALGQIVNALPGVAPAGTPVPVVAGALGTNLYAGAGSFVNSGTISSGLGNVTFNTAVGRDLVLNNLGGTISASHGLITFRTPDFSAKDLTEILGGDLTATALDIFGGNGAVTVAVEEVTGPVNVEGGSAHVSAAAGTLTIGKLDLTGDPYLASGGDLVLTENIVFSLNQATETDHDFLAIAEGRITAESDVTLIDVSSKSFRGGDVHLVAGFNFQDNPPIVSITGGGGTPQGGDIILPNVQIRTLSTSSNPLSGRGGNVTIVAREGDFGANPNTGEVQIGGINTSSAKFAGGNIFIVGGSSSQVRLCGAIDTHGMTQGGNVAVRAADPKVGAGNPVFNNGTLVSGNFAADEPNLTPAVTIGDRILRNGTILTSSAAGHGGDVLITGEGGVEVTGAFIDTRGVLGGGSVTIDTEINTDVGPVMVRGFINTSSTQGPGGAVTIRGNDSLDRDTGRGVDVLGSITTTGPTGAGNVTISSSTGSINVGFNPSDLSPLSLTKLGGIIANSATGSGGDVSLNATAGTVRVALGINASGTTGGAITVDADTLIRVDGTIDSRGLSGAGGDVSLHATGGDQLFGVETGFITTTGTANSGNVSILVEEGTIVVRGGKSAAITTTALNGSIGGLVDLHSLHNLDVIGGINTSGGNGSDLHVTSDEGMVTLAGAINTSGKTGGAGQVFVNALTGISIGGKKAGVTATGAGSSGGGDVVMNSGEGAVNITGSINTFGLDAVAGTGGGAGGDVTLNDGTGSFVTVSGSIVTRGGNASAAGSLNGGSGGDVTIRTILVGPQRIGGVSISGGIDTRGGTSSFGAGGAGGSVILESGTVQLLGTVKGSKPAASINASNGTPGTGAVISIDTFGTQPLPLNFDLASTAATEPALPGGVFEFGVPSVNGTKGALVSGTNILGPGINSRVVNATTNSGGGSGVTVNAFGVSQMITQDGSPPVTINSLVDLGSPNTSPRRFVTPGQALALFQKSRGDAQTIGLTSGGAVSDTAIGGGNNHISIDGYEFGRPFTAFNLRTAVAGGEQKIRIDVPLTDTHPQARIVLAPKLKSGFNVAGILNFANNLVGSVTKLGRIDLGTSSLTVAKTNNTAAEIRGNEGVTIDLVAGGAAGLWTNNGVIRSGLVLMRNFAVKQKGLTLSLGDGATIRGPVGGGDGEYRVHLGTGTQFAGALNIQNASGASTTITDMLTDLYAGSILMGVATTAPPFAATGPQFTGNAALRDVRAITSASIGTPEALTTHGSLATGTTLSILADALTVRQTFVDARTLATLRSINSIIFDNGNFVRAGINLTVDAVNGGIGDGTLGSDFRSGTGQIVFSAAGNITMSIAGGHTWQSGTNTLISAALGVSLQGTGSAGTFARDCGFPEELIPLPKALILLPGSFRISAGGSGGVTIGDNSAFSSAGGDVSIVALHPSGDISLGDESSFTAEGGNVSILAGHNIVGGTSPATGIPGNTFFARGLDSRTGGGVEILSGTTTSQIITAIAARTTPPTVTIPASGVTVNALPGTVKGLIEVGATGTVNLTNTHGDTVINHLNGAVLINGVGASTSVTLDSAQVTSIIPISYTSERPAAFEENVIDTGDVAETFEDWETLADSN